MNILIALVFALWLSWGIARTNHYTGNWNHDFYQASHLGMNSEWIGEAEK